MGFWTQLQCVWRTGVGVSHKRGVSHTIPSSLQMPIWCLRIQINSDPLPRWACLVAQTVKNLSAMLETQVQSLAQKDTPGERIGCPLQYSWASLVAQAVKNMSAIQKTWVRSLGWENHLEEGMATLSSIFAWRMSMDGRAWWATVQGVSKSQTGLSKLSTAQIAYIWVCFVSVSFHGSM